MCAALCLHLNRDDELFELIKPTRKDPEREYYAWGAGRDSDNPPADCKKFQSFTPLRRNLLLLMAAMNGEL